MGIIAFGCPRVLKFLGKMPRKLVWFENSSFAAWGCSNCNWIVANVGPWTPGRPPAAVQNDFDRHDCANFPRLRDLADQRGTEKP